MKKVKIFIVDDDNMFTAMLSDHLESKGLYDTSTYATGEDALKHMHENPDFVILDYYLDANNAHALNGLEILKTMHKSHPDTKIIMLSSQEHYGIAAQTIARGALHYVIKDDNAFEEINNVLKGMLA